MQSDSGLERPSSSQAQSQNDNVLNHLYKHATIYGIDINAVAKSGELPKVSSTRSLIRANN